jgi:hypothetical protein
VRGVTWNQRSKLKGLGQLLKADEWWLTVDGETLLVKKSRCCKFLDIGLREKVNTVSAAARSRLPTFNFQPRHGHVQLPLQSAIDMPISLMTQF